MQKNKWQDNKMKTIFNNPNFKHFINIKKIELHVDVAIMILELSITPNSHAELIQANNRWTIK